jgi:hypothetical protein
MRAPAVLIAFFSVLIQNALAAPKNFSAEFARCASTYENILSPSRCLAGGRPPFPIPLYPQLDSIGASPRNETHMTTGFIWKGEAGGLPALGDLDASLYQV